MSTPERDSSAKEFFAQADAVEAAVQQAVAEALRVHKLLGHTVVGWRDGKVVWIAPQDIVVDEGPTTSV
jgi:hypothetical protein